MSCRSHPSSSLATSMARLAHGGGMPDAAVLSLFHEARREGQRQVENGNFGEGFANEQYSRYLDRAEREIGDLRARDVITEARAESLRGRLAAARAGETPDAATVFALTRIDGYVSSRGHRLDSFLRDVAARSGMTLDEARNSFNALEREAPRARGRHAVERSALGDDIANDPGIRHAVQRLSEQADEIETARLRTQPQRIETMTPTPNAGTVDGVTVTSVGYDPRNCRLQVEVAGADGSSQQLTYCAVEQHTVDALQAAGGTSTWASTLRGNADHQYGSAVEAARDGVAPRCSSCGQFATASHACPVGRPQVALGRWNTQQRWSRQSVEVSYLDRAGVQATSTNAIRLPAVRELRAAAAQGPVEIRDIGEYVTAADDETGRGTRNIVRGNAIATLDPAAEGGVNVSTTNLACMCAQYQANHDCPHVRAVADAIRTRINPPTRARRTMTPEERDRVAAEAARRADAAAVTDWTRNEEGLADAAATWRRDSDVLYSENPAAFREDYQAALEASAAKDGALAVPYMRENALDGLADRASGTGFGVELEFDFPADMDYSARRQAIASIAQELHDAGITRTNRQEGYGASRRYGYVDTHTLPDGTGSWSFENDGSVGGGEVVTPVMFDEPETWEKLDKTLDIIKRHGGVPSRKAGAHVHVGTKDFAGNPTASYVELARLTKQHEDVYYRLASDPNRGTHRNNGYSKPAPSDVPAEGMSDVTLIRHWQGGRYSMVNYAHVAGGESDHPEFRLFDSSLDAGTVQAQVKLAVATARAAARNAAAGGTSRKTEPWGSHKDRATARGSRRRLSDEEFDADTATTRSLLDTLFRRREDKAQAAALFAHTKWTKPKGR